MIGWTGSISCLVSGAGIVLESNIGGSTSASINIRAIGRRGVRRRKVGSRSNVVKRGRRCAREEWVDRIGHLVLIFLVLDADIDSWFMSLVADF